MAIKLKPLGDKIIVEKAEEVGQTKTGIILPDNAKERPQTGKVIAVGAGKTLENGTKVTPEIKVGDSVYYAKYTGNEIKIEGKEFIILSESEILAIIQ